MPVTITAAQRNLVFWAAFLLLAAFVAASFFTTKRLIDVNSNVEKSQSTLAELDRTLSHLKDVETGARGYVITGDENYLLPVRRGAANVERSLGRLGDLSRGNSVLQPRVRELEQLASRRIELASATIRHRGRGASNGDIAAGIAIGKATMDRIRAEVAEVSGNERVELERQRDDAEQLARATNWVLGVGASLILALMAYLAFVGSREAARRRRAEYELRELNAGLESTVAARTAEVEQSRALLDAVIENMPDTVFLKDAANDFRYILVNQAGERLIGRQRQELLGHVDHELFPRTEATLCLREDKEVAESGQPKTTQERPLTTEHGPRLIESRKVPLQFGDDEKRYVLGIVRDVTDQKSLERQVRQMQRMEAVGRLTGGVAHDFNNLLAIIMGNVEMVREQLGDRSEIAELADEALEATNRGADLVRRLLAFARKQHLEPESVDLNARLPHVIPLLRRTLGETISIEVKSGNGIWPALIDPTQVDDALVNLAINARDAMAEGGALTIETSNEVLDEDYASHHVEVTPGDYVMLAVSDTGTGMTPETLQRAFEPFYTTKPEGQGTGLGLSQIYGWVKQTGGHIKIYSELGHGTTVKLYLPRAVASADETRDTAGLGPDVRGHEKVLVVEDNPSVLRTTARQLADLGYATIEAESGRSALDLVRSGTEFDIVLTDVVMPGGMSGYELAAEIERLRPGTKILFMSGYTELAESRKQAPRAGAFISKPYRKRELGQAIRRVLDGGR